MSEASITFDDVCCLPGIIDTDTTKVCGTGGATTTTTTSAMNTTAASQFDTTGTTTRIEALESLVRQLQEENRELRMQLESPTTNRTPPDGKEAAGTPRSSITAAAATTVRITSPSMVNTDSAASVSSQLIDGKRSDSETSSTLVGSDENSGSVATARCDTMDADATTGTTEQRNPHTQQRLDNDSIERYSRQMLILGVHGQQQLQRAAVLVIGAGGIGSTVLYYLAGAGIGTIDVMDHDIVEVSNLHRQIIHAQPGLHKAISAQQALLRFNPAVRCRAICEQLSTHNATQYIPNYDVIVDATDNATSRYIINDACVLWKKPLVSGSAITTQGQLTV